MGYCPGSHRLVASQRFHAYLSLKTNGRGRATNETLRAQASNSNAHAMCPHYSKGKGPEAQTIVNPHRAIRIDLVIAASARQW